MTNDKCVPQVIRKLLINQDENKCKWRNLVSLEVLKAINSETGHTQAPPFGSECLPTTPTALFQITICLQNCQFLYLSVIKTNKNETKLTK